MVSNSNHALDLWEHLDRILGKEAADRFKIQMTNFVEYAWKAKIRIINWPVGLPFFGCGISTRNGFMEGYENINQVKNKDLKRICDPRREHIEREMAKAQGQEVADHDEGTYFEVVQWSEGKLLLKIMKLISNAYLDERKLSLKDQAKLGTVLDENGSIVAAVAHSKSYFHAMKGGLSDTDEKEEDNSHHKSTTPLDLWASSSPGPSAPWAKKRPPVTKDVSRSPSPGPSASRVKVKKRPPPINRKTRPT